MQIRSREAEKSKYAQCSDITEIIKGNEGDDEAYFVFTLTECRMIVTKTLTITVKMESLRCGSMGIACSFHPSRCVNIYVVINK